jgi:hypothetical protein
MSKTVTPAKYELTRFNALRHGVLSKYTVLPWESEEEYQTLLEELINEYNPEGETEHYLIRELAVIMWRKRRLRLAEAAAYRKLLENALANFLVGVDWGLLHQVKSPCPDPPSVVERVDRDAVAEFKTELEKYKALTVEGIRIAGRNAPGSYNQAVEKLHNHTRAWWDVQLDPIYGHEPAIADRFRADSGSLQRFLTTKVLPWCARRLRVVEDPSVVQAQAILKSLENEPIEKLGRYEASMDRKFERTLAMLLKFQDLRHQRELKSVSQMGASDP